MDDVTSPGDRPDEPAPPEEPEVVPPAEPLPPPVSFKYANQEEAEKAALEAAGRFTQISQEAADLRRQLEEASSEPQPLTSPPVPANPVMEIPTVDEVKSMFMQGYKKTRVLDPNLENFEEEQTGVLSQSQAETIIDLFAPVYEALNRPAQQQLFPESQVNEIINARMEEERQIRVDAELYTMATNEGLDVSPRTPENPRGGAHLPEFEAARAVDQHKRGQEREAMISVIGEVKKRYGITGQPQDPATPPIAQPTLPPAPMERAGQGRPAGAETNVMDERPMHISELLELSQGSRTIRGNN